MSDGTNLQIKDRRDRHHLMSLYAYEGTTWKQRAQVRIDRFTSEDPRSEAVASMRAIGEALVSGELKLVAEDIQSMKKTVLDASPPPEKRPATSSGSVDEPLKKRPAAMKKPAAASAARDAEPQMQHEMQSLLRKAPSPTETADQMSNDSSEPEIPAGISEMIEAAFG